MIKIKTAAFLILVLFLFNNCGYTPQYAKKDNLNFSIEITGLSGDRDFNNALKRKLDILVEEEKKRNLDNLD